MTTLSSVPSSTFLGTGLSPLLPLFRKDLPDDVQGFAWCHDDFGMRTVNFLFVLSVQASPTCPHLDSFDNHLDWT